MNERLFATEDMYVSPSKTLGEHSMMHPKTLHDAIVARDVAIAENGRLRLKIDALEIENRELKKRLKALEEQKDERRFKYELSMAQMEIRELKEEIEKAIEIALRLRKLVKK